MASLICRSILKPFGQALRKPIFDIASRSFRTTPLASCNAVGLGGGLADSRAHNTEIEGLVPDDGGHSVGVTRFEIMAETVVDDPFDLEMQYFKPGEGTRKNPIPIPSAYNRRMVTCLCDEDTGQMQFMWIYKGEQKRCYCGFWFKHEYIDGSAYPE